jgi:hypothetical protein
VQVAAFTPGRGAHARRAAGNGRAHHARYRKDGYFVARAYLPAQDVSNHVVTIAVSEGRYGKVELRNNSRLSDGLANGLLRRPGRWRRHHHRTARASPSPAVRPARRAGQLDVGARAAWPAPPTCWSMSCPARRVSGEIDVDNAGDPVTGEWRLGATVNFNNLAGRGDVLSLRAVTSGSGLAFGRAAYQMQFGRVTAGVAYSHLDYQLGQPFDALGAHGTADVASVFGGMVLMRSRRSNLYLGAIYEQRRLEDEFDLFPADGRRANARVAGISLHGDHRDDLWGGGYSSFYVGVSADRWTYSRRRRWRSTPPPRAATAPTRSSGTTWSGCSDSTTAGR